jgi:hypothetical protein
MNVIEMHSSFNKNIDNNVQYTYDPYNPYNLNNNTINNEDIGANFFIFLFLVFISGLVIYNICNSCDQFRRNYFVSHNTSTIIQANIVDNEIDDTNEIDEIDEIDETYETEPPIIDNDSDELISYSELMASQSQKI